MITGEMKMHDRRCGTSDWPSFPEIGGDIMHTT